ncbi:hypothetical protein JCM3775_003856 [Rhodotorula graminis]
MSTDKDDFAAYTTIGDRTEQPQDTRAPLHARSSGPSFLPPPKLEPYLLLAKSARGAGAANLVSQAVAAPGVYVFGELLDQPSIRDLANHEQHAQQHRLLELFAFGTWADYEANRDSYPALTPDQETKLRHLTVLTLASSQRSIPYALLLSRLSLPDVATLEDLLIAAFYAGVLRGKLDAREQRLEVLSAQGRDVRRDEPVPAVAAVAAEESMELDPTTATTATGASTAAPTPSSLLASLRIFQSTLAGLIASLSAHLGDLHARNVNADELEQLHEERVEGIVREAGKRDIDGGAGGGKKGAAARKSVVQPQQGFGAATAAAAEGGDMDVDAASMPSGGNGGGGGGAFSAFSALTGAIGLGGSGSGTGSGGNGGGSQGQGRGAAGSPTGGGAAARARKRNRQ